ncbi:MAG: acyltransferase family protein [Bacilli bacterium]|nr:acyltransferase family protein [Bacilli bacterium]
MKRITGLDLVRFIAVLFVPSVHFFLNNGFYETNVKGIGMFISILFRWLFYIGVPLFMLLTGYLKRNDKLDKKYYKRIINILLSYIFISIICILFRKIYLGENIRILKMIISIFDFTACGYAWYVEMYIGLFLIIPFLNILYNSLDTKKKKQYLILTLISICSIYPLVNYLYIDKIKLEIIPDWWSILYPYIYYFIGAYINEYQVEIKKKKGIFIFVGILLLETILTYIYSYNDIFSKSFLGGYNSLLVIIMSTIFFLLIYKTDIKNKIISKIITNISKLSLDIYLFSYIVDLIIYKNLDNYLKTPIEYLKFMMPIVLIVFVISYLLAIIKYMIFKTAKKIIS